MARDFSGSSQYLHWGDDGTFKGLSAITTACWVRPDSTPGETKSILRKDGTHTPFQVINSGVDYQWAHWDAGASLTVSRVTTQPFTYDATWQHFAVRWGTTSNSGIPELFRNGSKHGDCDTAETSAIRNGGTTNFAFGATESGSEAFDGGLAEVAQWNRVLSDGEIAMLGDGYSPLFILNGLIAYRPLRRAIRDLVSATVGTNSSSTVAAHPRIIYPTRRVVVAVPASVAGGGTSFPFPYGFSKVLLAR